MKLRELEMLRSFREMQDTVSELNQRWQVSHTHTHSLKISFTFTLMLAMNPGHVQLAQSHLRAVSAAPHVTQQQHGQRRRSLEGIAEEERHERTAG